MKIIIDLLGFRREVDIDRNIVMRGEILFPLHAPIIYSFSANDDVRLRFEFRCYEDEIPIFLLDNQQEYQIYKALGGNNET